MIFHASSDIGLTVFDRNSQRKSCHYDYPSAHWIDVQKAVAHTETADIYRRYIASINVNTINNSQTAFSRRLVEILASGGFVITNPTPAINRHFQDFCETVDDEEQALALFNRLSRDGWTTKDRHRMRAGIDHVLRHHTWKHRLEQIVSLVD